MTGTAPTSSGDETAGRAVAALTVELIRRCTSLAAGLAEASGLAPTDVTGLRALDVLGAGPVPVRTLRERLTLSSAAATGLVDRLESAGLARRRADPGDRRQVLVELTPLARQFGARHLRPIARRVQRFVDAADDADLAIVHRFLAAVLADDTSTQSDG